MKAHAAKKQTNVLLYAAIRKHQYQTVNIPVARRPQHYDE